jgi:hypothetical protein
MIFTSQVTGLEPLDVHDDFLESKTTVVTSKRLTHPFKWIVSPKGLESIVEIFYYGRVLDGNHLSRGYLVRRSWGLGIGRSAALHVE